MTRVVAIVVALTCSVSPAFAQSAIPIAVDQRVRITMDDSVRVGRIVGTAADSLRISIDGSQATSIATASIRKVEVSRGARRRQRSTPFAERSSQD